MTAEAGDTELPLDCPAGSPVRAIVAAFSITRDDVLIEDRGEGDGGGIKAECAGGTAQIRVDGGLPASVGLVTPCGAYTVYINSFSNGGEPG